MDKIQKIINSELKYRRLFEAAQDGIIILSYPDGKIIDVNPFLIRMLGYELEYLKGKKLWEIGFIENKELSLELFEKLIKNSYIRYESLALRKSSGEPIFVEFISNSYQVDGEAVIQCNIRDIHDRIQAEKLNQLLQDNKINHLHSVVSCLSTIIEYRDFYTAGHQFRVADLAGHIAQELDLPAEMIMTVKVSAMLHDIGKFSIPIEILTKPQKLSGPEYALVQTHVEKGYQILKTLNFEYDIANVVLQHHERLDGSGYPKGLRENEISLEAKILSVADVTEAMVSKRFYREGLGIELALEEITKNKGILYDEHVVEACLKLFRQKAYEFPNAQFGFLQMPID